MNEFENPFYNVYYLKMVFHLNVTLENPLQMLEGFKVDLKRWKTFLKMKGFSILNRLIENPFFLTVYNAINYIQMKMSRIDNITDELVVHDSPHLLKILTYSYLQDT